MTDCITNPIENCGTCTPLCSGADSGVCSPPGWNMYDISPTNCEHHLFESTLCEITDIQGFPVEYRLLLPENDWLHGEDPNAKLSYPSFTKAIYTPQNETNILDMFGLTADDTMQYVSIPKSIFARDLSMMYSDTLGPSAYVQPRVGDIIKTLWNDRNYEVVNISEEENIFMAKKFVFDMIVKPFRFSEQSDEHREVFSGLPDDPFESIVPGPSGDVIQNNYGTEMFGDNEDIDKESSEIYDYDDEGIQGGCDPDENAFGR
ncbi:MAG: hypothetical protein KAS32_25790 [Candidatus Peribacteraceae bacterium]|nr:hypothetical protein [Candidatus Peribacteraceae bacterium]